MSSSDKRTSNRTFGYFSKKEDAIRAVENNWGNMEECLYTYLVMENIPEGIHPCPIMERWYEWKDEKKKRGWVRIGKPKIFKEQGIVNWAIG